MNVSSAHAYDAGGFHVLEAAVYSSAVQPGLYKVAVKQSKLTQFITKQPDKNRNQWKVSEYVKVV